MNLYPPNVALFVIAGCLAMMGVLASLPIELPIPGLVPDNSAWYIFLGWFLLAAGTVLPPRADNASASAETEKTAQR
jgi:hypothetical protein